MKKKKTDPELKPLEDKPSIKLPERSIDYEMRIAELEARRLKDLEFQMMVVRERETRLALLEEDYTELRGELEASKHHASLEVAKMNNRVRKLEARVNALLIQQGSEGFLERVYDYVSSAIGTKPKGK